MADSAAGYARPYNWTNDAAQGVPISQTEFDADGDQVAAALNNRMRLDGQGPLQAADVPMNGHTLTGLRDGVQPGEAATVRQVAAAGLGGAFAYCAGIVF